MKVDKGIANELLLHNKERLKTESTKESGDSKRVNGKAEEGPKLLSISKEAELLDHLKKLKNETDDMDMKRVDYYRDLVQKGEHVVDSGAVAKKLGALILGGDL